MAVEANSPIVAPSLGAEPSAPGGGLHEHLATISVSRWLILYFAGAALIAGVLYVKLATPIYRSTALIQVEEKKKGIAGLDALSALLPPESATDSEIEILRSRSLSADVVQKLSLDVVAVPRHFPLIGAAIARSHGDRDLARPPRLLSRFAWGGERINVDRLAVPPALENETLVLSASGDGRYQLFGPDGSLLLDGEAGKAAESASRSVSIFVSDLRANRGAQFLLRKMSVDDVIDNLQSDLLIFEKGRKTGIIRIELAGPDREQTVKTLNALAEAYLRQNVERKSEEAERTLEFVSSQLPDIKSRLEKAEQALNEYRSTNRTVDVPLETKAAIDRSVEIEKMATELQMQRAELAQRFTPNHPFVASVDRKLAELQARRSSLNAQLKTLPESDLASLRLLRDVKVSSELYTLLLNKAQELRVVKSGTIGNVRILDRASIPRRRESPRGTRVVAFALVLGLAAGVAAAFTRRALSRGVSDPDVLEAATGLGVYVSVPHSDMQDGGGRAKPGIASAPKTLANRDPNDLAIESLRSLRTSLQFALIDAPNRVIVLTGPSPGIGKSFIASNLAQVLADSGRRVLLVDGDMRNGSLHREFSVPRAPGLSEAIAGAAALTAAVHHISDCLDLLTGGMIPPNPSELLMSPRFTELIDKVSGDYEMIVVDTPPILAVTDAAVIGRHAGVTLLVLRAGQHPLREIALALKRLAHGGVRPAGLVLNDVRRSSVEYGYTYQYAYPPKAKGRAK